MRILRRPCGYRGATASATALLAGLVSPATALASALQDAEAMAPLPVDPPIGGLVWTVLIPTILLLGSFVATYLLYRRFAGE